MNVAAVTSAGQLRRQFAARLANVFASEGREGTAALDARLLLAHALEVDATRLALCDDDPVDPRTEALATALIDRRIAGEPVARIVGKSAFWGMEFDIDAQTLVPRPDSETLVEAALAFVDRRGWRERTLDLLDLGTGSGILLLALLSELPGATGIATDVEPGAILVAHRNAMRLNLADRAMFAVGNWGDALCGGFDLVLANPPYIESAQIGGLQVEVARHDPHMALDGGADGLDAIRRFFRTSTGCWLATATALWRSVADRRAMSLKWLKIKDSRHCCTAIWAASNGLSRFGGSRKVEKTGGVVRTV